MHCRKDGCTGNGRQVHERNEAGLGAGLLWRTVGLFHRVSHGVMTSAACCIGSEPPSLSSSLTKITIGDVSTKLTPVRQHAAMPTSTDPVAKLLMARAAAAADIAGRVLSFADPCDIHPNLRILREIPLLVRAFEATHCGVLQVAGMSWDALAGEYEISRQSLHKRLAPVVDGVLGRPPVEVRDLDFEYIETTAGHLRESLNVEAARAPSALRELRKYPHWWHDYVVDEWYSENVQE